MPAIAFEPARITHMGPFDARRLWDADEAPGPRLPAAGGTSRAWAARWRRQPQEEP